MVEALENAKLAGTKTTYQNDAVEEARQDAEAAREAAAEGSSAIIGRQVDAVVAELDREPWEIPALGAAMGRYSSGSN